MYTKIKVVALTENLSKRTQFLYLSQVLDPESADRKGRLFPKRKNSATPWHIVPYINDFFCLSIFCAVEKVFK